MLDLMIGVEVDEMGEVSVPAALVVVLLPLALCAGGVREISSFFSFTDDEASVENKANASAAAEVELGECGAAAAFKETKSESELIDGLRLAPDVPEPDLRPIVFNYRRR